MPGPPSYRHGRIVWAYLRSNVTGKRAVHPGIILDRDEDIIGFGGDVPPNVMTRIDNAVHQHLVKVLGIQFGTIREMFEELPDSED